MAGAENDKTSRREALTKMFQQTGLLGMGGMVWGANVQKGKAADLAMQKSFVKEVIPVRSGGSIPIIALFEEILGVKSVLMGII